MWTASVATRGGGARICGSSAGEVRRRAYRPGRPRRQLLVHLAGAERLTYLQLNRVADDPDEPLVTFVERLFAAIDAAGSDRLVIDLRGNGGGNTFLTRPLLHRLIGCDRVNRGGGLFVVIGRRTFSAAQNLATLIGDHTRAVFVGEPTGSSPPPRRPVASATVTLRRPAWRPSARRPVACRAGAWGRCPPWSGRSLGRVARRAGLSRCTTGR